MDAKDRAAAASEHLGPGTRMALGHSLSFAFPVLCVSALLISLPVCCLCFSGLHSEKKKAIERPWVFVVQLYLPERD